MRRSGRPSARMNLRPSAAGAPGTAVSSEEMSPGAPAPGIPPGGTGPDGDTGREDGSGSRAGAGRRRAARRIAVLRALPGLGDMLCLVPALRAVRAAEPEAHITLVGLASSAWFPGRYPALCDELLVLDGVPGIPEVRPDPPA